MLLGAQCVVHTHHTCQHTSKHTRVLTPTLQAPANFSAEQDVHTKRGIDVEMWMMTLERQMRIAMRETLRDALEGLPIQVR